MIAIGNFFLNTETGYSFFYTSFFLFHRLHYLVQINLVRIITYGR